MGNWSGQLDVRDVSAWLQEPQVELKVGVGGSFRAFSSAVAFMGSVAQQVGIVVQ